MLASDVIRKIPFADPVTHDLVCKTMVRAYSESDYDDEGHRIAGRMFAREFADAVHTNLSWLEITKRVVHHVETHKHAKILRYPVHLLIILHDEGLYQHHDREALDELMPHLRTFVGGKRVHTDLFNPAYRNLYGICFSYYVGVRYSYPILVNNNDLRKLLFKFGNSAPIGVFKRDVVSAFFANFEHSLPLTYTDHTCLTTEVIASQAAYYKELNLFWGHYLRRPQSMPSLMALFYRWIYETFPNNTILSNKDTLNEKVLYQDRFTEMLIGGSLDYTLWHNRRKVHGMGSSHYNALAKKGLALNDILDEYAKTLPNKHQIERFGLLRSLFSNSLREDVFRIRSYKDFNESTFVRQLEFFRSRFAGDPIILKKVIDGIRRFYAYHIDKYPDWEIFKDSRKFSKATVKSRNFSHLFIEGYEFVTLSNIDYTKDITKLVVSFSPSDIRHYSTPTDYAYYSINCSSIPNRLYRNMFLRYIFSNMAINSRHMERTPLVQILKLLFSIKTMPGAPSADISHLSAFDADQIRTFIIGRGTSFDKNNRLLNACKQFFLWAEESELMTIAPMALVHFRSIPSSGVKTDVESVPKEHIEQIAKYLLDKKEKSFRYELCFVVLNLILQTPFRAKDICRLERDCLIETGKEDVHIIRLKSKTSANEYEDRTIPLATYRLIKQTLRRTEAFVEQCSLEEHRNKLFLMPSPFYGGIIPLSPTNFYSALSSACKALGLPAYSSTNFRKAYMTFTYIESTKRSKEDGDYFLKTNSYHKNKRTTLVHYVDRSKVLINSKFGYSLGTEEELNAIESSYQENPPKDVLTRERRTPDGIGFCNSKECIGMVTCLGCKHLVLTEDSVPALNHIITSLDEQIVKCEIAHERDGLIDIRAAYSRCLDLINKRIQTKNESISN